MQQTMDEQGFAIVRGLLSRAERDALIAAMGPAAGAGRRGLLGVPSVATLARSARVLEAVRPHVGGGEPFPVRAILFNKSPEANWLVAWHQDLTIAVRKHIETPGFGPWTVKGGIPHVQPPVELLERMIAVRIHLDDAEESNGALRVLAGTHRLGRLSSERIAELRETRVETVCCAAAGDALLMRPLLLHASSRSGSDRPRRVLHLEYAALELPGALSWHDTA